MGVASRELTHLNIRNIFNGTGRFLFGTLGKLLLGRAKNSSAVTFSLLSIRVIVSSLYFVLASFSCSGNGNHQ